MFALAKATLIYNFESFDTGIVKDSVIDFLKNIFNDLGVIYC